MLKQRIATVLVGGLVLGGGAIALAETSPADPDVGGGMASATASEPSADQRAAARACIAARRANPEAAPSAECQALRDQLGKRGRGEGHRPGAGLLRRGIHGEVIVEQDGGGFETVEFDKGTLTSVGDSSLVLERDDGMTVRVTTNDATKFRGVEGLSELRTGDKVFVVSKDGVARLIAQRPADAPDGEGADGNIANRAVVS